MALTDVNLVDRDLYVEGVPHETFKQLRHDAPVTWHAEDEGGAGFWSVHRYADVVAVNRDNQTFSSHIGTALINDMPEDQLEQQRMMMLNMDPPLHTRYRLLVNKGFTPRMVGQLEERSRSLAAGILDRVCEKGECDFVVDIASELPLHVIAELLGIPAEDRHLVFDWSNRMVGHDDAEYQVTPEDGMMASLELYSYGNRLAAEKRADPHEDILSVLSNVSVDGEHLSELELDM